MSMHEECAQEDEVFEDGAETQMECNKCVCACGNSVCTALTYTGEFALLSSHSTANGVEIMAFLDRYTLERVLVFPSIRAIFFHPLAALSFNMIISVSWERQLQEYVKEGEEEEEMTEEEWDRRVARLKALQVNIWNQPAVMGSCSPLFIIPFKIIIIVINS